MMTNDLREQAIRAISNYMHDGLFDITGDTKMFSFIREQAEILVGACDNAISATKHLVKSKAEIDEHDNWMK